MHGTATSYTQVVVDSFHASPNEPARVHAEVGARVDQELPFNEPVRNEEAACSYGADMCRR
jgi:hypothetical protein